MTEPKDVPPPEKKTGIAPPKRPRHEEPGHPFNKHTLGRPKNHRVAEEYFSRKRKAGK